MLMPASQDLLSRTIIAVAPDRHAPNTHPNMMPMFLFMGPLNWGNSDKHGALGYDMALIIC